MSPPSSRTPHQPTSAPSPARRRPTRRPRRPRPSTHMPGRDSAEERVYWAQIEEREFGRLAQETDHLFDSSAPWAT